LATILVNAAAVVERGHTGQITSPLQIGPRHRFVTGAHKKNLGPGNKVTRAKAVLLAWRKPEFRDKDPLDPTIRRAESSLISSDKGDRRRPTDRAGSFLK
jgi:hypothetical protein